MGISYRKYHLVMGIVESVIPEALQTMSGGVENAIDSGRFPLIIITDKSLYLCF
jgi:hypothetical protein